MKVKKGEKALKSITYIPVKDKTGKEKIDPTTKKKIVFKKSVNLFFHLQVEKASEKLIEYVKNKQTKSTNKFASLKKGKK